MDPVSAKKFSGFLGLDLKTISLDLTNPWTILSFIVSLIIGFCYFMQVKKTSQELKNAVFLTTSKRRKNLEILFWIIVFITSYSLLSLPQSRYFSPLIIGNYDTLWPILTYTSQIIWAFLSLCAFYLIFMLVRQLKAIEDTPTANIRSATQGYVELEGKGKIDPSNLIYGPLTKRPCLWYQYCIRKRIRTGRYTSWQVIESGESNAMILLQDETGECFIDPEKAEMDFIVPPKMWYGATERPEKLPVNHQYFKGMLIGSYQYQEQIVLPDENLYAIGMFRTFKSDIIKNKNKALAIQECLKQWKRDYQTLLQKFDTNQDGKLSEEEWNKIIEAAENEIKSKYPDSTSSAENEAVVHVLSSLNLPKGKPFIVSNLKQSRLIKDYKNRTWVYTLLFIGFAVLALNFTDAYSWYWNKYGRTPLVNKSQIFKPQDF